MIAQNEARHWDKLVDEYGDSPQLGPILKSYFYVSRDLDSLKRDLRSSDNIDALIEVSKKQIALKEQLNELLHHERKNQNIHWWNQMALGCAALLLGVGFYAVFTGVL